VTVFGREADCERAGNHVTRPSDAMDRGHEIDGGGGHREHERERDSNRIDRKAHGERERKHRSERDASERRAGKLRDRGAGRERTHPGSIRKGQAVVTVSGRERGGREP